MKTIFNFLYTYFTLGLTVMIFSIVIVLNYASGFEMGVQLMGFSMLGLVMILCLLLLCTDQYISNKKNRRINFSLSLVILGICVLSYFDILNTNTTYEFIDKEVIVEQTQELTLIHIEGYVLYEVYKEICYNNEHPLELYSAYKIDRFGCKTMPRNCLKSDLMDDYVFLKNLKRRK